MTYDVHPNAPERAERIAEQLHEYSVNELGLSTYDVLFTAHEHGNVTGELAEDVAVDDGDQEVSN